MIEIKVDASRALARFSPAGIPETIRRELRTLVPGLTKKLGAIADRNLVAGTKSRRRIAIRTEMVENPSEITGRVRAVWLGEPSKAMVPRYLEYGTKAHEIAARNALALRFFWPRVGKTVMFKRVWHPGTRGIFFMSNAFSEMRGEIRSTIESGVKRAAGR